jgi:hypothetical protein
MRIVRSSFFPDGCPAGDQHRSDGLDHLTKPVNLQNLERVLQNVMEHGRRLA